MNGVNSTTNLFMANSLAPSENSAIVRTAEEARIQTAAKEFEATFLSLITKELRQTEEPDGLFAGDTGDVFGGLFDQLMGQHLASAGGVGLAQVLEKPLRAYDTTRQTHGYGHTQSTNLSADTSG